VCTFPNFFVSSYVYWVQLTLPANI